MMKEIKRKGWANAKSGGAARTETTFSLKPILTGRVTGSEKRRFDVYKQYTKTEYHS